MERIAVANRDTARVFVKGHVDMGTLSRGKGDMAMGHGTDMMATNREEVSELMCTSY